MRVSHVPVTIVADAGELRSGVPDALRALDAKVELASLIAGDYLLGGSIAVERKAVPDLHRSIANGRLWAQLLACRQQFDRTYLLVEGSGLDRGHISRAGIRGALLEVGDRGVTVIRSIDANDSALWLVRIAARLRRAGTTVSRRREPKTTTPLQLLSALPGVGSRTAGSLLETFGSLRAIANAETGELERVAGIGPARAATIKRLLTMDS